MEGKVMRIAALFFLFALLFASVRKSDGEVFKVGNAAGWTILGNVNYTAWASANTFHVGDSIVFIYNKQFHNVLEVNRADYRSCNPISPIVTYGTGNDSIHMKRRGHHFFICGVPGHCSIGQKVDIRIPKLKASSFAAPPPSTSKLPPPSSNHSNFGRGMPPNISHASNHKGLCIAIVMFAIYKVFLP